jgi:hypothetical protein
MPWCVHEWIGRMTTGSMKHFRGHPNCIFRAFSNALWILGGGGNMWRLLSGGRHEGRLDPGEGKKTLSDTVHGNLPVYSSSTHRKDLHNNSQELGTAGLLMAEIKNLLDKLGRGARLVVGWDEVLIRKGHPGGHQ